ncbi:MAG: asparagine synthase (glutamine-hydrolyzing) [Rhodoferax sp.]
MCGIVGQVSRQGPVDPEALARARDRIAHRGPDDAGLWRSADGCVGLGHRRLSIIDLSATGHQPMVSPCGRYVVVFNGEVYNYLELRQELERLGCRFSGSGDTEVVLTAFTHWGPDCLARFNGMFALAILDQGTESSPRRLFLARDRVGKKPLYYQHDAQGLRFGSELKTLDTGAGLDLQALNHYLALGYVPADRCLARGVHKLPPAHAAEYLPGTGVLRVWRYWSLPALQAAAGADPQALADEAQALLLDAVRIRLRSDVPVGVLLSGGLDSSLVAACAAQAAGRTIKTFTISFPGTRYDEASHALQVARHFATDHHVLELPQPTLSALDGLAPLIDEPIADSSLIPSYLVSQLTVRHVKVALGGDGGDELFGGYSDYTTALQDAARWGGVPMAAMRAVADAAAWLPAGVRGRNRLAALRGGPLQSLVWGSPYFDRGLRQRILGGDARAALGADYEAPEQFRLGLFLSGRDPVDSMTRTHFGSILPDDFMVKVDRASMAVALELRAPLLDVRLVEFAFGRLPSAWKVQGTDSRRLQKLLARRLLPPSLDLNRKQGFSIPLNEWLRSSRCAELQQLRTSLPGCIDQREVDRLIAGHQQGRANGGRLFALMMLALAARNLGWNP